MKAITKHPVTFTPDPAVAFIDLLHVTFPSDYYCAPEHVIRYAHSIMCDDAIQDHINAVGAFPSTPAGDAAYIAVRRAQPVPSLEEARAMLESLGLMTFAEV